MLDQWTLRPYLAVIDPLLAGGVTPAGIYIEHDERLPKIFGRILKAGSACGFAAGDVVVFEKYATEPFVVPNSDPTLSPTRYDIVHVDDVLAVLEGYDDDGLGGDRGLGAKRNRQSFDLTPAQVMGVGEV